jgi:hypothetical protein
VGVRALAKNSRHRTPDRTEAEEGYVANLFACSFASNDTALAGGMAFRGTCHRSIIAEAEWWLGLRRTPDDSTGSIGATRTSSSNSQKRAHYGLALERAGVARLLPFWLRPLLLNAYNEVFLLFTPQDFRAAGFARLMIGTIQTRKVQGWPLSMSCPRNHRVNWGIGGLLMT